MRLCLIAGLLLTTSVHADPTRYDRHGDPLPEGAIRRIGSDRFRHLRAEELSVSADGRTVRTLSADGRRQLWDARTGRLKSCRVEEPRLPGVFPSPDGSRRVSFVDGRLEVRTVPGDEALASVPLFGVEELRAVGFGDDPDLIATVEKSSGEDVHYGLRVWNLKARTLIQVGCSRVVVHKLEFLGESRLLTTSVSSDGVYSHRLWDAVSGGELTRFENGKRVEPIRNAGKGVPPVAVLWENRSPRPDEPSTRWRLWDPVGLRSLGPWQAMDGPGDRLKLSSDRRRMLRFDGSTVDLLRADGSPIRKMAFCESAQFSPDGKAVFLLQRDRLRKYDSENGARVWGDFDDGVLREPGSLLWSSDGSRLVVGDWSGSFFELIDVQRGVRLADHSEVRGGRPILLPGEEEILANRDGLFSAMKLSDGTPLENRWTSRSLPDGRHYRFASLDRGKRIRCVNVSGSQLLLTDFETSAEVVPESRVIADLKEVPRQETPPEFLELSSDGRILRHGNDHYLLPTGERLPTLETAGKRLRYGSLSADGQFCVGGLTTESAEEFFVGDLLPAEVRLWERLSGRSLFEIGERLVSAVATDLTGRFVAVALVDGIGVWDASTGKRVKFFRAHLPVGGKGTSGYAGCLAFSPDGKTLASGLLNDTILLWDTSDLPPVEPIGAKDFDRLWDDLGRDDPKVAVPSLLRLAASPEVVLPILKERLKPSHEIELKELAPLLADLFNPTTFRKREIALRKLEAMPDTVISALKAFLEEDDGLDLNDLKRLRRITERSWSDSPTGEELRLMRVVRLLESIGGPESSKLVERLSEGATISRATQEARSAVERMRWAMKR